MSSKDPAYSLRRFMHGIYFYHQDKGMPLKTAKARMYDETLDACFELMKSEELIPEHATVIAAQFMFRVVNQRGLALAKELKEETDEQRIEKLRTALQQLNQLKTTLDEFISHYEGGENSGKRKK
jgi:hypothetical protein